MRFRTAQPANQIDAGNDVAPLIAATHLQSATISIEQDQIVVGLQQRIAELGEGNSVFGFQTPLDRFFPDQIIYREEFPDVAQKLHHRNRSQPIEVVDDARRIGPGVEIQKALQLLLNAC